MAMAPLDQNGKNAIAVAVVLALGAFGYYHYFWSPVRARLVIIAAHADTLDAMNDKTKRDIAGGMESKIRADAARYTNELLGLRRLVPTVNEVPALVESVSSAARQVGLDVSEFSPDGKLVGDDFDIDRYKFGVIGPYHKVAELLTSIASSPRIIVPINVVMSSGARPIDRRPGPDEAFSDVKFGVITYVAKTKAIPPAPK